MIGSNSQSRQKQGMTTSTLPVPMGRSPPKPPKFLVLTGADAKTSIVKIEKMNETQDLNSAAFKTHLPGLLPIHTRGSLKNSKTDAKGVLDEVYKIDNEAVLSRCTNVTYMGVKPRGAPSNAPPSQCNLPSVVNSDSPAKPFIDEPLFGNGSPNKKSKDNSNRRGNEVGQAEDMNTVGPENPVKQLNDEWTCYWDAAAGSVYYYNHLTGEATWINPLL